jgi:hypothetical protein
MIAYRQLVIKLMRLVGVRITEPAIIKPEFNKDLTTRLLLLKRQHQKINFNKVGF